METWRSLAAPLAWTHVACREGWHDHSSAANCHSGTDLDQYVAAFGFFPVGPRTAAFFDLATITSVSRASSRRDHPLWRLGARLRISFRFAISSIATAWRVLALGLRQTSTNP